MILEKYSIGIGDRFGRQGKAQLKALAMAKAQGVDVVPVWNKSYREHQIIKSFPEEVRKEADEAIKTLAWRDSYYVDADHINLSSVDLFLSSSDFFSLDVADFIGKEASSARIEAFVERNREYIGSLRIPGFETTFPIERSDIEEIARKYLLSVEEAAKVYRHVEKARGKGEFVVEVSMDESDRPQTPIELFFILSAIAQHGIPAQTIAPKFTGRFNKGVDYVGNLRKFATEFEEHLLVIGFAVSRFQLPGNLKLSVHSGSDKFSIYRPIHKALKKHNAGLHVKTAGTTWLEELIGLAMAGGQGLSIAQDVYRQAVGRFEELCSPYAPVLDIEREKLPSPKTVQSWSGQEFASCLRHDPSCLRYNPHFRQLLHVGYKVAAEMGERYLAALEANAELVGQNVTENLYARHLRPIFMGE